MRLLVFTVVGAIAFIVAYSFGLGPAPCTLMFLFVLFIGALDRVSQPLRQRLRA